jgi:uncharacterized protein YjiS (DUF1127 family)
MTFAQLTTVPVSAAARTAGLFRNIALRFMDWQERRATREMLRTLDGRTLKDIGVDRNEIESLIYGERNDRRRGYRSGWR